MMLIKTTTTKLTWPFKVKSLFFCLQAFYSIHTGISATCTLSIVLGRGGGKLPLVKSQWTDCPRCTSLLKHQSSSLSPLFSQFLCGPTMSLPHCNPPSCRLLALNYSTQVLHTRLEPSYFKYGVYMPQIHWAGVCKPESKGNRSLSISEPCRTSEELLSECEW